MNWEPTELQQLARLDPDVNPAQEAEARVRAAVVLLGHWLESRDAILLDAVGDMVAIARWWSQE